MAPTPENAPCWQVPQRPREIWVHSIPCLDYSPSLPSSPARQLAIQRCIPSQLCVSLSTPLPSLLPPACCCFSSRSRKRQSLPHPLEGGVGCPDTGNWDPLVSGRWFSLPCHSTFYTKASHNYSLPAVWLSGEPPILPSSQAGVRILPPPLLNGTTGNMVSSECNICMVCICVL